VSSVRVLLIGERVVASCAITPVRPNLQKFVPSFHLFFCLLCVLLTFPHDFLFSPFLQCRTSPPFSCRISDPSSHFRTSVPWDRYGVRPLNCAFSRARAGILVHIFPLHGISNGNENSLNYGYKMECTINDPRLGTACPLHLPPCVSSRPSHGIVGLDSFRHNVPASRAPQ